MNLIDIPKLVINLPDRPDRLESFKEQFKYIDQGGDSFEVIPGIRENPPLKGIAEAHKNAIRKAKENHWPQVLILEDDVLFQAQHKTIEFVQNALHNLPEKWDILLGGVYEASKVKPYNDYWMTCGQFCSLHFYIVNSHFYDHILTHNQNVHIDRWINHNNNFNIFIPTKFFAIQKPGKSDNTGRVENYEAKLMKFKLL